MAPHPRALAALERLREGNQRFVSDVRSLESLASASRRGALAAGQNPHAIVLGCSDARAPAELVFDQGLGDLFVIRVAGNVVAPSGVGSVEFAAERFGVRLVVVMGHTHCGAIAAAVDAGTTLDVSRPVLSIVSRVRPAVDTVLRAYPHADRATLLAEAVHANVRTQVAQLSAGSALIERLVLEDGLLVVGAVYDLESGRVDFI